jgi:hypothetical protein
MLVTLALIWATTYSSVTHRELTWDPYIIEYLAIIYGLIVLDQST